MMRPIWWIRVTGCVLVEGIFQFLCPLFLEFHDGNGFVLPRHPTVKDPSTFETKNPSDFPHMFLFGHRDESQM